MADTTDTEAVRSMVVEAMADAIWAECIDNPMPPGDADRLARAAYDAIPAELAARLAEPDDGTQRDVDIVRNLAGWPAPVGYDVAYEVGSGPARALCLLCKSHGPGLASAGAHQEFCIWRRAVEAHDEDPL